MRDPHVETLTYLLQTDGSVHYTDPAPVAFDSSTVSFHLAAGVLSVRPFGHFTSEQEARDAVEPYLRMWEASAFLNAGKAELLFEFRDSRIVDRNPPQLGMPTSIQLPLLRSSARLISPTIIEGRREYPAPPGHFALSRDVGALLTRYKGFKRGEEPLLAMAYYCLTLAEGRERGRVQAAQRLAIAPAVLSKIGELTSTRGDNRTARKHARSQQPLSQTESRWLDTAIRKLIGQIAQVDAGGKPPQLSMESLPKL